MRARKPRRDWKPVFLKGLAETGTVRGAAALAGVHRSWAYRERQRSEPFALAWADVEQDVSDRLEETALTLALAGDHHLLTFMLKARRPDTFREHHQVELAGPDGGPVKLDQVGDVLGDLSRLSDRQLSQLQNLLNRTHDD